MNLKEEILRNSGCLDEGIVNNTITKKLQAGADYAERSLRIAEKNHPEYTLSKSEKENTESSKFDIKMTSEQKAFALRCRDLTELREMIKNFHKSKDRREKIDLLTEIIALLEGMPKRHRSSEMKNSIYSVIGFGAFMYAFALPVFSFFRLFGVEISGIPSLTALFATTASLSAYSTVKTKRAVSYVKNINDNISGVKKGKENIKSLGKRDRFSSDLEKYRNINLDVDSEKAQEKYEKRVAFINKIIRLIISLLMKIKKSLESGYKKAQEYFDFELKNLPKAIKEGYFDDFNSVGDIYITEEIIQEGIISNTIKTVILTSAILMGLSTMGISTRDIKNIIRKSGGEIISRVDNNVESMRKSNEDLDKKIVMSYDSSKKVLDSLLKKLYPMLSKTSKTASPVMNKAKPVIETYSLEIVSSTCFIASGIIDGISKSESIPSNIKNELIVIKERLKKIGSEMGAHGDENKTNVVSDATNLAYRSIKKARDMM